MSTKQKPPQNKTPAWLSLSSGIILVIFGLIALLFETYVLSEIIWMEIIPFTEDISTAILASLISGVIIISISLLMLVKPKKTRIFGIVVIVFSVIACFGMGIFTIGGIIGITGGVFAILDERKKWYV